MIIINKQSYMAELAKLLGFMSAWDRRDTLQKYDALFDEAANIEELVESIGTPTKLAISLALNYVPSPAPEIIPVEAPAEEPEPELEGEFPLINAPEGEEAEAAVAEGEERSSEGELSAVAEEELPAEPVAPKSGRKVRFFGLLASMLFTLVIGIPVAIVLICLGLPFVVGGLGLGAGVVWAAVSAIPMLALFSDILAIIGVGLILMAIAILLIWFGLWVSFELGYLWISGVILRLGRALTYKKEVAAE